LLEIPWDDERTYFLLNTTAANRISQWRDDRCVDYNGEPEEIHTHSSGGGGGGDDFVSQHEDEPVILPGSQVDFTQWTTEDVGEWLEEVSLGAPPSPHGGPTSKLWPHMAQKKKEFEDYLKTRKLPGFQVSKISHQGSGSLRDGQEQRCRLIAS